jgi:putative solute:sodium symporter small subunit
MVGEKELVDVYERYWNRLKKITVIWMLAWTVPAIILELPANYLKNYKILSGIPLHWFMAAFVSIVIGIALIFLYAYVMEKTDREILGKS